MTNKISQSMRAIVILVFFIALTPRMLFGEEIYGQWIQYVDNIESLAVVSTAVDVQENVYVTGAIESSGSGLDIILVKYSKDGDLIWSVTYDGDDGEDDIPNGLVIDENGNILITGESFSTATNKDIITLKYDLNGSFLWEQKFDLGDIVGFLVGADDVGSSIALDVLGNVYVSGTSYNNSSISNASIISIKYNSTGGLEWIKRLDAGARGLGLAESKSMITDYESGDVYITGNTYNTTSSYADVIVIKYDSQGTEKWISTFNGTFNGDDTGTDIAIDEQGNVYVVGNVVNEVTGEDVIAIKYNSDGIVIWSTVFDQHGGDNNAAYLELDEDGSLFITGSAKEQDDEVNTDIVLLKLNGESGEINWTQTINNEEQIDEPKGLLVDDAGNPILLGSIFNKQFGGRDFLTVKYNSKGELLWSIDYVGKAFGTDIAQNIAQDADGNIYVTGKTFNGTIDELVTIKYNQVIKPAQEDSIEFRNNMLWFCDEQCMINTGTALSEGVKFKKPKKPKHDHSEHGKKGPKKKKKPKKVKFKKLKQLGNNKEMESFEKMFTGYESLRKACDEKFDEFLSDGGDPADTTEANPDLFFLRADFLRALINKDLEVAVGNRVYKWLNEDSVVVIADASEHIELLEELRDLRQERRGIEPLLNRQEARESTSRYENPSIRTTRTLIGGEEIVVTVLHPGVRPGALTNQFSVSISKSIECNVNFTVETVAIDYDNQIADIEVVAQITHPSSTILEISWDLGDNGLPYGGNVNNNDSYINFDYFYDLNKVTEPEISVTLRLDNTTCSASHKIDLEGYDECSASINGALRTGSERIYDFEDHSVANLNIISHKWTFGDGDISRSINPYHLYKQEEYEQKFVVTQTIETISGCTDVATFVVDIEPLDPPAPKCCDWGNYTEKSKYPEEDGDYKATLELQQSPHTFGLVFWHFVYVKVSFWKDKKGKWKHENADLIPSFEWGGTYYISDRKEGSRAISNVHPDRKCTKSVSFSKDSNPKGKDKRVDQSINTNYVFWTMDNGLVVKAEGVKVQHKGVIYYLPTVKLGKKCR
ncbi:MAG: hypothetical protein HRT71_14885 [Flavobacteriales bacterium]|nr:hypothetical protein [Flavobacteriales bacterium]